MIKQVLKIIWAERKINIWILLELTLAFSILWFCGDYLIHIGKQYFESQGFDIERVYSVNIGITNEGRNLYQECSEEEKELFKEKKWQIVEAIKAYPPVESVAISRGAAPYSGSSSQGQFMVGDISQIAYQKSVTPEFFDVYKIDFLSGRKFDYDGDLQGRNVIISGNRYGHFGEKPTTQIDVISMNWGEIIPFRVIGSVPPSKMMAYMDYEPCVYSLFKRDDNRFPLYCEISLRVKPQADRNFVDNFIRDMKSAVNIAPYYLSSVVSIKEMRKQQMLISGYTDTLYIVLAVVGFLMANIFLGVIGTFWFRMQSRKADIGLRMAMGASKRSIYGIFLFEALLLLFIASGIGAILSVNILVTGVLSEVGIPFIGEINKQIATAAENSHGVGAWQYLINYAVTFFALAIIIIVSVWYPAKKASDIPPVEALRSE